MGLPRASLWGVGSDFVQERFPDLSPGDFESMLTNTGDSETRASGRRHNRRAQAGLLWFCRSGAGKKGATWGCVDSLRSQRKGGPGDRFWGIAWDALPLPSAPHL